MKKLSDKINLDVILPLIKGPDKHATVSGYRVGVHSVRLDTFAVHGTDCICCGRKGSFFRVEDNGNGPHLNLYAYTSEGEEALMTRDHIVCRSHGGPETVENMSPMCSRCNRLRGVTDQAEFLADYKAGKYSYSGVKAPLHPRYKDNVARYIQRFREEGHLSELLNSDLRLNTTQLNVLMEACIDRKDTDGQALVNKAIRSGGKWIFKLRKYYTKTYVNKRARSESGISDACTVEIRELVDEHVAEYGFKSHMIKAWEGLLRRSGARDELFDKCTELNDTKGIRLVAIASKSAKRSAIAKYARVNYGGHGSKRSDYDLAKAKESGDIRPAFGILISRAQNVIKSPTPINLKKLSDHLKLCKELR